MSDENVESIKNQLINIINRVDRKKHSDVNRQFIENCVNLIQNTDDVIFNSHAQFGKFIERLKKNLNTPQSFIHDLVELAYQIHKYTSKWHKPRW